MNKNHVVKEGEKSHLSRQEFGISDKCANLRDLLIMSSKDQEKKFDKLIHLIGSIEVLTLAYERIKLKPGSMTSGATKEILDEITRNFRDEISKELRAGKFKFTPARRMFTPKLGKKEKRPLRIRSTRDKVVEKALQRVLERIYEPRFKESSHGFRSGKGAHTALKYIYQKIKASVWFIEADISECLDKIPHKELMKVRAKKITCQKTLALLKSARVAGYVNIGGTAQRSLEGTPQGSVLSPLLCNIFLDQLDEYRENQKQLFDKGTKRKENPAYGKIIRDIKAREKLKDVDSGSNRKKLKALRRQARLVPSKKQLDHSVKKMQYVRYADDFLISVIGTHDDAVQIKEKIKTYLKTERNMDRNEEKILITEATKKVLFLGTEITKKSGTGMVVRTVNGKGIRASGYRVRNAPIENIINKLDTKLGIVRYSKNNRISVPRRRLTNLDHGDIRTYFNAVTRGIRKYYSFAANRSSRHKIVWRIWNSCAKTLGKKYKLNTVKKVISKFGKSLEDKSTGKVFYKPLTLGRTNKFASNEVDLTMLFKKWANKMTQSNLNKSCIISGSYPAEMHHKKVHHNILNEEERNRFELNKKNLIKKDK